MKPRTLSATSAQVYETCPARYRAEQLDRTPRIGGWAAGQGNVIHSTLEKWVKEGLYVSEDFNALQGIYDNEYYKVFSEPSEYEAGIAMLRVWHARQDWSDRTVLSVEAKEHFMLPTPDGGKIKFNYIMDRLDQLSNGDIEVVDYKTSGFPIQPDILSHKLQARAYALAAQMKFPEAPRIWVTFDMLKFDPVGVVFTKEQNRDTYRYLTLLVERIVNDDNPEETLNEECRWCVRRHECKTLRRHINGGGPLKLTDPQEAADKRAELAHAKTAIDAMLRDVDAFLLEYCEREDLLEFETDSNVISVGLGSRRYANPEQVAKIVGPEMIARYGTINVSAIDAMLKGSDLTTEQKSQLRQSIGRKAGNPVVKTARKPTL